MTGARRLQPGFRAATAETVIGLLAVTGMRAGEVIRLDRTDIDLTAGRVMVTGTSSASRGSWRCTPPRWPRFAPMRAAATSAGRTRPRLPSSCRQEVAGCGQSTLNATFAALARAAGLQPEPESRQRRATPHGLRHTFAVTSLIAWYRAGDDVQARLPALSAYMGHAEPKDTYWYLSAVPELLALASDRTPRHNRAGS